MRLMIVAAVAVAATAGLPPVAASAAPSSVSRESVQTAGTSVEQSAACTKPCNRKITDDYPYKKRIGKVDPYNFWAGQCTSFAAWRINDRLKLKFHNNYKGVNWGDAKTWDDAAKKVRLKVDRTPKVGNIAVWNDGRFGHVAYVARVDGSKIVVEEYNKSKREAYSERTISRNDPDNYIHFPF
ncbi:CHAP domain-containing protein [Actinomadura sp. NPDC047616]|uniref:CHAP domain-containing protein n=1 Tax=Actinomadura sp. NPDC047616 TaxID=3155914 RepID=UPI0033DD2BC3